MSNLTLVSVTATGQVGLQATEREEDKTLERNILFKSMLQCQGRQDGYHFLANSLSDPRQPDPIVREGMFAPISTCVICKWQHIHTSRPHLLSPITAVPQHHHQGLLPWPVWKWLEGCVTLATLWVFFLPHFSTLFFHIFSPLILDKRERKE